MRRNVALLVALAVALLGSCSSGSGRKSASKPSTATTAEPSSTRSPATTGASTSTTVSTTTTATTTTACPLAGTTSAQANGLAPATMLLTAVNATADGCLARLKWVFRSTGAAAAPGYRVEYKAGPFTEDGSGAPVTVKGSYFLVVRFEPAAGADLEHGGTSTYSGPKSILTNGVPHVLELRRTGDFEGVVTWVVGLDAVRPVEATTSAQPPTLTLTLH